MRKTLFIIAIAVSLNSSAFSQKNSLQVGPKFNTELTFFDGAALGFGGQVVYRINKHSGLETGLYYQNRKLNFITELQQGPSHVVLYSQIAERRIQVPILYRFDSRIINFVAGPTVDYFAGWKETSDNGEIKVTSYSRNAISLQLGTGISKTFNLTTTLLLEPEIKFNLNITDDDVGLNLGIALRKKLF